MGCTGRDRRTRALLIAGAMLLLLSTGEARAVRRSDRSIEILVEDSRGRSVRGAQVVLEAPATGERLEAVSDQRGRALLHGVSNGEWALRVEAPGAMIFHAKLLAPVEGKPSLEAAYHENRPAATTTLRIRTREARLPSAPSRSAGLQAPPASGTGRGTAPAPEPERKGAEVPAPETPRPEPVPAAPAPPAPEPEPVPVAPTPAAPGPETGPPPVAPGARGFEPPTPPAPRPEPGPAAPAPPTPEPEPVPVTPTPAAPERSFPTAADGRGRGALSCPECRPGELAFHGSVLLQPGTPCAPSLADSPTGCAELEVALPPGVRYAGYRLRAGRNREDLVDCFPGRSCLDGSVLVPAAPRVTRDREGTRARVRIETSSSSAVEAWLTLYAVPQGR